MRGALHGSLHRERDLRGENALVATDFFYFGLSAVSLPDPLTSLLATTQGHKNTVDRELIDRFWAWLSRVAPHRGRCGLPSEFSDTGCQAHRGSASDD